MTETRQAVAKTSAQLARTGTERNSAQLSAAELSRTQPNPSAPLKMSSMKPAHPLVLPNPPHPAHPPHLAQPDEAAERLKGALAGAIHGFLVAVGVLLVVCPILLLAGCSTVTTAPAVQVQVVKPTADFNGATPSADAKDVANWIAASGNNAGLDFVIVDKKMAKVYAFDAHARLRAFSAALMGSAVGDDTLPGVGKLAIADVKPEQRTTPAGRFVAERGLNARGEDVVWVDYDNAVSMHRVVNQVASERRLERLASNGIADKRISYGCINLPVAFYEQHIRPMFAAQSALVYVLPEVKTVEQVFHPAGLSAGLK